jgi:hypothetical protein
LKILVEKDGREIPSFLEVHHWKSIYLYFTSDEENENFRVCMNA